MYLNEFGHDLIAIVAMCFSVLSILISVAVFTLSWRELSNGMCVCVCFVNNFFFLQFANLKKQTYNIQKAINKSKR